MNMELMEEMNRDLANAWKSLEEVLEQAVCKLQVSSEGLISATRHSLRGEYQIARAHSRLIHLC